MATSKRKPTSARTSPARAQSGRGSSGPPRAKPPAPGQRRTSGGPTSAASGETPLRIAVAKRSRGLVVLLSRQPQFLIPAVMLALMLVGLLVPILAVAVPALVLVVVFVGWLAFLSWPVLAPGPRAIRILMIAAVAFAAVGRVAGWF